MDPHQVVRTAAMRKVIWISSLVGIVLIASVVAMRWQERAPDDEQLRAGAVRFLQTSAVRRIVGAISVDASAVTSLERAPGLRTNAWIVAGDVTIEDIWGRSERYDYRAELESLCEMYRRSACWNLESLSIGDWSLTDSTPTALGLDGLGMMTAPRDPPLPKAAPAQQQVTEYTTAETAEQAVKQTTKQVAKQATVDAAEPSVRTQAESAIERVADGAAPKPRAPAPAETADEEMPEPVRFAIAPAEPKGEPAPAEPQQAIAPAEPQKEMASAERQEAMAPAPDTSNPDTSAPEPAVSEPMGPDAQEPDAMGRVAQSSDVERPDKPILVLAPGQAAAPAGQEPPAPESSGPEPAATVAVRLPEPVRPAESAEPTAKVAVVSTPEPAPEPVSHSVARISAEPPASQPRDLLADVERRIARLLDSLGWGRSGHAAVASGVSVTIALPPIGPASRLAARGQDGVPGGAVEIAMDPSEASERDGTRDGLLERVLDAVGWGHDGRSTEPAPDGAPRKAAPDEDGLDSKQRAFAALQDVLETDGAEAQTGRAGASSAGRAGGQSGGQSGGEDGAGAQPDLLSGQRLDDKLSGSGNGQGGLASRAQSYYSKALELSATRPEVFSMKIDEPSPDPESRAEATKGAASQAAKNGDKAAPGKPSGLAAAVPQSAEITITASLSDHQALLASEPLLSASISDSPAREDAAGPADASAPADLGSTQTAALVMPKTVSSGVDWVQLGIFRVPANAPALWRQLQRSQPDLLGGLSHEVVLRERDGKDTLHILQVGPLADAAAAHALCGALSERGIDCVAVRRPAALPVVQAAAREMPEQTPARQQAPEIEPAAAAPLPAEQLPTEPAAIELVRLIPQPQEPALVAQDGLLSAPRHAAVDPGGAKLYEQALALNRRGQGYYRDGRYDRAIEAYDEAIRLDPGFASAYNNRGEVYYRKGDYDQAILDFSSAIHLAPHYSFAFYNRASANKLQGNTEQAIADLTDVIRLNPQNDLAYHERAQALYLLGRHQEALDDASRAVALSPGQPEYLLTHAQILAALGYRSDALGTFEEGLSASEPEGVKRYQQALMRQGFYEGPIDGHYSPATRSALMACIDVGCEMLEGAR